jgi:glycosyltransferase involved in cell wall biosynthesis
MSFSSEILQSINRVAHKFRASRELIHVSGKIRSGKTPIAISVLHNEMLRLPRFLAHYRSVGVGDFVVIDNNSTDGTREYLSSQKDVCLYFTDAHFEGKERWVNLMLRRHGLGRWCVVVDADEILAYPDAKGISIPTLCHYLEGIGSNALHAILLDLYPGGQLAEVNYAQGEDYFDRDWYFDPFESLELAPRHFHRGAGLDHRFMGGMRKRVFGVAPCCTKFPLLRYEKGMFLSDGQHYLEGGRFPELRAVLYHFKYLQDFEVNVLNEVRRNQYVKALGEYAAYAKLMERCGGSVSFRNENSIPLSGTKQLESCGYLVNPPDYMRFSAQHRKV